MFSVEKYNVDPKQVTVSGFSSGGAQAMQFHFCHSSRISGVGIFSGGRIYFDHFNVQSWLRSNNPTLIIYSAVFIRI